MGSQIAQILADIYLENLLDSVIPKIPFNILFLLTGVDDILTTIPTEYNKQKIILAELIKF